MLPLKKKAQEEPVVPFATATGKQGSAALRKTALRVDRVSMSYQRGTQAVQALDDITLDVGDGEFVAVVGPSGCGKSTLLKLVVGLRSASEGEISVYGRAVAGPRRDVGIVFQSPVLLPWRTILQNVLLPVEVLGLRGDYRRKARDLLDLVGLSGFADMYPNELSGGMQQRAGIARALICDPPLLLMDEPFGALDAMTREQMNIELQRIWSASGKTVIFVTHSISEAVFLADRIVVMSARPGRVLADFDNRMRRPRQLDDMVDPEFGRLAKQVRALLGSSEMGAHL